MRESAKRVEENLSKPFGQKFFHLVRNPKDIKDLQKVVSEEDQKIISGFRKEGNKLVHTLPSLEEVWRSMKILEIENENLKKYFEEYMEK